MEKIAWSTLAVNDLDEIYDYISRDSTYYARITIEKIFARVHILLAYPETGRIVPEFSNQSVRELIEGNYRIVYKIKPNKIYIVRVHHGARNFTKKGIL